MLAALTLFLIGAADLARSGRGRVVSSVATVVVWAAAIIVATTGLGIQLWCSAICLLLAGLWLATTTSVEHLRHRAGFVPAVGLGVVVLAFLAFDRSALSLSGFLVDWHESAPLGAVRALPLATLLLGVSVALFLVASGNIVVRAALHPRFAPAPSPHPVETAADDTRSGRWKRAKKDARAAGRESAERDLTTVDLRGGRLIGPVERLLIAALTLSGSFAIVAALVAAKGIVRFPEISRDSAGGSRAEYFLVGSLVSWAVAIALAGLVWVSAQA
jgi:hypothetical protein